MHVAFQVIMNVRTNPQKEQINQRSYICGKRKRQEPQFIKGNKQYIHRCNAFKFKCTAIDIYFAKILLTLSPNPAGLLRKFYLVSSVKFLVDVCKIKGKEDLRKRTFRLSVAESHTQLSTKMSLFPVSQLPHLGQAWGRRVHSLFHNVTEGSEVCEKLSVVALKNHKAILSLQCFRLLSTHGPLWGMCKV